MRILLLPLLAMATLLSADAPPAVADGPKARAPGLKAKGTRFAWKAADGLAYHYRVPKSYDAKRGVGLTLLLHGSNMDHRWGFANHSDKTFRPDDLVVSPDGTTPNTGAGFNFMNSAKDVKRLHALVSELRATFKINGVYIYGHSQGSFFALLYAGAYPDEVQGVVAHASGMWSGTRHGKASHGQAIVLMHGTQDPVVPYGQSVGGYDAYVKARYPMIRLRSLEGWNHWPAEHNMNLHRQEMRHTSQQLAWVEGMTTADPERLATCFAFMADSRFRERHDYAGTYRLANHVAESDLASGALKARAKKVAAAIEGLAEAHAEAIRKDVPKKMGVDKGAWLAHMLMFRRSFMDVPAHAAFVKTHGKQLAKSEKAGLKHLRAYWKARNKGDEADAFLSGIEAVKSGFCFHECGEWTFLKWMQATSERSKELKLGKRAKKDFDATIPVFQKALAAGEKAFDRLNKKQGKLP